MIRPMVDAGGVNQLFAAADVVADKVAAAAADETQRRKSGPGRRTNLAAHAGIPGRR